ncbi:hypothetical protein VP01_2046g1 [Puccinia sorghi]|uniref:Uncharacterized protein n=1 Tax=Puccinia sorghi TaxID=27349 RepID=A0A0L6VAY7_9BASI|nr:hypothetical protein VP01_2046g1 [Puccinia sorghi]
MEATSSGILPLLYRKQVFVELARLNEQTKSIVEVSRILLQRRRLGKIKRLTACLDKISQSLQITRTAALKTAKKEDLPKPPDYISQIETVVELMKIFFKKKINSELFSNKEAFFQVGPLDQDSSDLVLERLRVVFIEELEKSAKFEYVKDRENLEDDLLNLHSNTVFLILNSAREFGLIEKESLIRILNIPDTLVRIAKSDLNTISTHDSEAKLSGLESLKWSWRKSLNDLIEGQEFSTFHQRDHEEF